MKKNFAQKMAKKAEKLAKSGQIIGKIAKIRHNMRKMLVKTTKSAKNPSSSS
jgi:hypothetical protein